MTWKPRIETIFLSLVLMRHYILGARIFSTQRPPYVGHILQGLPWQWQPPDKENSSERDWRTGGGGEGGGVSMIQNKSPFSHPHLHLIFIRSSSSNFSAMPQKWLQAAFWRGLQNQLAWLSLYQILTAVITLFIESNLRVNKLYKTEIIFFLSYLRNKAWNPYGQWNVILLVRITHQLEFFFKIH